MSATTGLTEKLQSILREIGETDAEVTAPQKKTGLTAQEVARLIAGEGQEDETVTASSDNEEQSGGSGFAIDFPGLEKPLAEANGHWEINYYRPIYSCRKFVGRWIVLGKRILRKLMKFLLEPLVQEQTAFNASVVQALNALRNNDLVFQSAVSSFEGAFNTTSQAITQMQNQIAANEETPEENIYDRIDYFAFQEQMRGSVESIKNRMLQYLDYYAGCKNVLDLGCGRGEFLDAMREHGIYGVGVDTYDKSVQFCRSRGLTVVQEDAIKFLKEQESCSADGIFSAQLIEHIPTVGLFEICQQGHRILKQGGYIILETPNPMCLSTFMNGFYVDPTHRNPIHPKLVEYYLRESGFSNIKVLFTEQSKIGYRLPLLNVANSENLAEFNDGVNFVSDILFGSQDYAVIAQKL